MSGSSGIGIHGVGPFTSPYLSAADAQNISGLLYGVAVYFVMYGIVLRLTFHRNFLTAFGSILQGVAIHMVCVGLPISFAVHRFSKSLFR